MKKIFSTAAMLSLALFASTASAQFYVAGDVASTDVKGLSSKTGYGVTGGYEINKNFAAEVGYKKLGTYEISGVRVRATMVQMSALASLPLSDQFSLYGRLGYGDLKASAGRVSISDSGAIYGAGVRYAITPALSIRGEYTKVASDTDQFGVGLVFKF